MAKLSIATKPAIALGVAAVAALAVTGITAQAHGGKPGVAGTTPGHRGDGPGRGHGGPDGRDGGAALATALGVSASDLQAAVEAIRSTETHPDPATQQAADAKALADALGVSTDTITKVLAAQRPAHGPDGDHDGRHGRGPVGTTPGSPTDTTPKGTTPGGTTPDHRGPGGRGPGGGFGGPRGGFGHGGPGTFGPVDNAALITALAKATGKDEAAVKAALQKLADARKAAHDAEEADFAKKLAAKLGLDEAKVAAAIKAARPTPPVPGTTPKATP